MRDTENLACSGTYLLQYHEWSIQAFSVRTECTPEVGTLKDWRDESSLPAIAKDLCRGEVSNERAWTSARWSLTHLAHPAWPCGSSPFMLLDWVGLMVSCNSSNSLQLGIRLITTDSFSFEQHFTPGLVRRVASAHAAAAQSAMGDSQLASLAFMHARGVL